MTSRDESSKGGPEPGFTVRRLGPGDIPSMRAFNALFGLAFAEPDTYGAAPPDDAYLADLLAKAHVAVLVAERDGTVLGGLVAYELDKFERARREIYLYDLAVEAEHRRRGIATALIRQLQAHAAGRGAWVHLRPGRSRRRPGARALRPARHPRGSRAFRPARRGPALAIGSESL